MTASAKRTTRGLAGIAAAMLLGSFSAGCTTNGPAVSLVNAGPRGTVAFESIDGLPEGQFRKLVQSLTQQAELRQLAMVSRAEPAQYRVRGYAAAHMRGKRTTISWVWDIYDADRQRTLRISGEEHGGAGQRGWAAADDMTLDRIARDGMTQLAGFLGGPASGPPPTSVPAEAPAVVAAAEPAPGSNGWTPAQPSARQPQAGLTTHAALGDVRP